MWCKKPAQKAALGLAVAGGAVFDNEGHSGPCSYVYFSEHRRNI